MKMVRKVVAALGLVATFVVAGCGGSSELSPASLDLTPQEEAMIIDWNSMGIEERLKFCSDYLTTSEEDMRAILKKKAPTFDEDVFIAFYDHKCDI